MCTLSIIRVESPGEPAGLRVVMNRDESRERPEALYPRWRELAGSGRAIWPTDPTGGGTWIAATSQGLVLCLLNLNLEPRPELPPGLVSRGQVIPRVAQALSGKGVVEAVGRMDLMQFAPFRLVVAQRAGSVWECRWDRERLSITEHGAPPPPLCFVSSGLGDSKVAGRLRLFETEMADAGSVEAQDRFHVHAWPGETDISVLMSRDEARTVSITAVEVEGPAVSPVVRMHYRPILDDATAFPGMGSGGDRKTRQVAASGLKR